MKVSILTQPLGHNYGGLLQAYALQAYLKNLGCDVETIDRRPSKESFKKNVKEQLKNILRRIIGRINSFPTQRKQKFIFKFLHEFRDAHVNMSPSFYTTEDLIEYVKCNPSDLLIVGSDQVWRPRYSPSLGNYFFDFYSQSGSKAKRISYAASFGVEHWEFSAQQTELCSKLLRAFDAVTVRETSGVELCSQYFHIQPECVVDPTLLLEEKDYQSLIPKEDVMGFEGKIVSYVLDPAEGKQAIVSRVSERLNRPVLSIKPDNNYIDAKPSAIKDYQYPKVEHWLQSFYLADYIVTDSFHGCVFSIIFNKPFLVVGNESRGLARFDSLLSMIGLEHRLVASVDEVTESKVNAEIDWDSVNRKKLASANLGKSFLKKYVLDTV